MANRKLKSLKFPGIDDTYILDAGNVNYSDEETYEEGSVGKGLNALKEDIKDNYAKNDGYYENLGAGTAEQLVSTIFEEDSTPYNFRTSGGSIDIGDRLYDEIVGGTVAWNQKVMHGDFDSTTNWYKGVGVDSWSASSNVLTTTINGGSTLDPYKYGIYKNIDGGLDATHKYLSVYDIKPSVATTFRLELGGGVKKGTVTLSADVWSEVSFINTPSTYNSQIYLYPYSAVVNVPAPEMTIQYRNAQLFDLTAMFGSAIADYIYNLEQATAGAGVAWFKKVFPKPYYAYNAGELLSVSGLQSHDMVGFNAFDVANADLQQKNWENIYTVSQNVHTEGYTKVIGGATYCFHQNIETQGRYIRFYDADYNWLENDSISIYNNNDYVFTVPTNAVYLRVMWYHANGVSVAEVADGDICINLSWDGERDGEYEEYVKHSYSLDSSLTLRGIPKLDASNNLYYDGDTYESDGTVTRKYGIVDLGTLTWAYNDSIPWFYSWTNASDRKATNSSDLANVKTAKYVTYKRDVLIANDVTGICIDSSGSVVVRDANYTDAAAFKTAMSGIYLVYELATPTTETADPYTNPQIVDDFGTEEYVTTSIVPVGHNTKYQPNLRAKLEMAPNSPDGSGEYIVTQANGENSYTPLASSDVIQGLIARIEALEGAEGGGE